MTPYNQQDGSVLKSPVIKVVRDTPGFTNNRYHVYGRIGDKNKALQHVRSMKTQIKTMEWKDRDRYHIVPKGVYHKKTGSKHAMHQQ